MSYLEHFVPEIVLATDEEEANSQTNEGDMLGLAESFKEVVEEKNKKIHQLTKTIMVLYSLFVILDNEIGDHDVISFGRSLSSQIIDEILDES